MNYLIKTKEVEEYCFGGKGYGDGDGSGNGFSYGGFGYGSGKDIGYGNGDGSGNGDGGYGFGYGGGDGSGNGYGDGFSYGNGNGYGNGEGGYGTNIAEVNGHKLYEIDGILTAITRIHGNIAQGFVLRCNQPKPCYVVKEGGKFAHGETLHDAFLSLQEKLYDDSTEKERITAFVQRFPDYDTPYANNALFAYHHVLTGSCRMGRAQFCENHGISLSGKTTVRQFVELTKGAYGGDTIQKLTKLYNNNNK